MPPRSKNRGNHYGEPGSTITGQERADIVAMIERGMTRNDIQRATRRSGSTISGIAKAEGLTFGRRDEIRAATAARTADNRAKRAEISAKLLAKADALLDEMDGPFLAFNIGGKDNVYTEHPLDAAPSGDKRNLMQAASTALGRHIDLERHDVDEAAGDARSMLAELGKALGVRPVDDTT